MRNEFFDDFLHTGRRCSLLIAASWVTHSLLKDIDNLLGYTASAVVGWMTLKAWMVTKVLDKKKLLLLQVIYVFLLTIGLYAFEYILDNVPSEMITFEVTFVAYTPVWIIMTLLIMPYDSNN